MKCCEITGCGKAADVHVRRVHPVEALRWDANLCMDHAKESQGGMGEIVLSPVKEDEPPEG